MSNFQPLAVVDRGSETQPQVVEYLNTVNLLIFACLDFREFLILRVSRALNYFFCSTIMKLHSR